MSWDQLSCQYIFCISCPTHLEVFVHACVPGGVSSCADTALSCHEMIKAILLSIPALAKEPTTTTFNWSNLEAVVLAYSSVGVVRFGRVAL